MKLVQQTAGEGDGAAVLAPLLPDPPQPPTDSPQHPAAEEISLPSVLGALSDPMRMQIVLALASAGAGSELACKTFGLPVVKSTATHHFRVLREAGVISQRVVGTTRLNSLRRETLDARFPGLLDAVLGAAAAGGAGAERPADTALD